MLHAAFRIFRSLISMSTNPLLLSALLLCAGTSALFSQKDHVYASTGQQKLLINPALAASTKGLDIQTLASYRPGYSPSATVYTGVSYSGKKLGIGLSNSYYSGQYYCRDYASNQTDLSISYKVKLSSKVTLVPSLQASFIEKKVDDGNITFHDLIFNSGPSSLYIVPPAYPESSKKQSASFSTGLLLDINKTITFGVAVYDINQPDVGLFYAEKLPLTQHYHLAMQLFKDKKISLQPYAVVKLQGGNRQKYGEIGAFTSYKMFSLHTGLRNEFAYAHVLDHLDFIKIKEIRLLAGINFSHKGFKLGYTINTNLDNMYNNGHEIFLSAGLFNKNPSKDNLMLN